MPHSTTTTTSSGRHSPLPIANHPMLAAMPRGTSLKSIPQEHRPFPPPTEDHHQSYKAPISTFYNPIDTSGQPFEGWIPRRDKSIYRNSEVGGGPGIGRHDRQKSLSDAFRNIRTRRGSVGANAHELADALRAPVSPKLITLCLIWYLTSALTNTSSKSILNAFPKPVTLTLIQFAFVSAWCLFFSQLASAYPILRRHIPALQHGIRPPTRDIIRTTLPLAAFQIGGHLLSSTATSKIPVSLVHTIKGLSPLFTVLAYRFFFHIHYAISTYLSLIPLTLGVMLACSASFSGNVFGILCAFGGAIIFVTQNIFSKKLFNEAVNPTPTSKTSRHVKLDKLNLLCYSSLLAFLLTSPLWLYSEGLPLLTSHISRASSTSTLTPRHSLTTTSLTMEFLFNGTFHFLQNIMAFILLSLVSPVTYSVASLVKRIFVIVVSIVWFGNATTPIQAAGIALTFLGLYLYDRTSDAGRHDKRAPATTNSSEPLLPLNTAGLPASASTSLEPHFGDSPVSATSGHSHPFAPHGGYGYNTPHHNPFPAMSGPEKDKSASTGPGGTRPRGPSMARDTLHGGWPPPGTRQEDSRHRPSQDTSWRRSGGEAIANGVPKEEPDGVKIS